MDKDRVRPDAESERVKVMEGGVEEAEEERAEEEQRDEADKGMRKPMRMQDPKMPTEEERKEHELTHLPYRCWCRHCVAGRGKEAAHRRKDERGGEIPEVHFDYAFMGDEGDAGNTIPMLVARVRGDRMTLATAVPRKSAGDFVSSRVLAFLKEVGIEAGDVIVKSDQEPAIMSLVDTIGRLKVAKGGRWIVEASPVGSHASNGVVERAIQSVQGQVRVMKDALEAKWKVKIPAASAVIPWLMEYSAYLLNRFEVGHDGKTAYERCKGKKARSAGIEFGEAIMWRRKPTGGALGKLSVMWNDGVFLGIKGKTGEYIVGDAKGVWKTRTLQRKPLEERWPSSNAELIRWTPWRLSEEDAKMDGEKLEVIRVEPRFEGEEREPGVEFGTVPRRGKIMRKDLEEHGYTAGCEGCKAALAGKQARAHSEKCRKRFEEILKDEPRMKGAVERQNIFLAKVVEEEDKARREAMRREEGASSGSGITEEERKRGLEEVNRRVSQESVGESADRTVRQPEEKPESQESVEEPVDRNVRQLRKAARPRDEELDEERRKQARREQKRGRRGKPTKTEEVKPRRAMRLKQSGKKCT